MFCLGSLIAFCYIFSYCLKQECCGPFFKIPVQLIIQLGMFMHWARCVQNRETLKQDMSRLGIVIFKFRCV